MNIWIRRLARDAKCSYCSKIIDKGTIIVAGHHWIEKKGSKWRLSFHWHDSCWLEQGKAALLEREEREPRIETRGRKRKERTAEDLQILAARKKVMSRHAAVLQRIRKELDGPNRFDKLAHLGLLLGGLEQEMNELGGCPVSWLENQPDKEDVHDYDSISG